jgi:hypothetical protein
MPVARHQSYYVPLIAGESSAFRIMPKENKDITDLRELIKDKGKNRVFSDVDVMDLTLWKVRMIMGQRQHSLGPKLRGCAWAGQFSLLTGYVDPLAGVELRDGLN